MLGKRSRPIQKTQSKFHLMSSENRDCSGSNKSNGFFNNRHLFIGLNSKIAGFPDGDGGSRSPTSILDAKVFSDYKPCRSPRGFDNPDSQGIGLGILAALHNENPVTAYNKTTLLSPKSSETRIPVKTLGCSENKKRTQPISIGLTKPLSERQDDQQGMEYSESYTCITSHGPKPVIRQIFNDPVKAEKRNLKYCKPAVFETAASYSDADTPSFAAADFLSVCYLCRRQLCHGKDIYMYRGDKAFCSEECRYQQIVSDEKERCSSTSIKRVSAAFATSPQASGFFFPGTNLLSTGTMAAA